MNSCCLIGKGRKKISRQVNPEPRTYVRGFESRPFGEVRNIHPRTRVPGILWFGVKGETYGQPRVC